MCFPLPSWLRQCLSFAVLRYQNHQCGNFLESGTTLHMLWQWSDTSPTEVKHTHAPNDALSAVSLPRATNPSRLTGHDPL